MPAAKAGLAPGMRLVAVDGKKYTLYVLRDAIRLAKRSTTPLQLLTQNGDYFKTYPLDYHGGDRYPYLERIPGRPDLLGEIIRGKTQK